MTLSLDNAYETAGFFRLPEVRRSPAAFRTALNGN